MREPGTDWVRGLHVDRPRAQLAASRLALVEVAAAAWRRQREGDLDEAIARAAVARLALDFSGRYRVLDVDAEIAAAATDLAALHKLRALDSVVLASALILARRSSGADQLTLVSADRALNAAASAESLAVVDPAEP